MNTLNTLIHFTIDGTGILGNSIVGCTDVRDCIVRIGSTAISQIDPGGQRGGLRGIIQVCVYVIFSALVKQVIQQCSLSIHPTIVIRNAVEINGLVLEIKLCNIRLNNLFFPLHLNVEILLTIAQVGIRIKVIFSILKVKAEES